MASGASKIAYGSLVGSGAAISVRTVEFRPRSVHLYNTSGNAQAVWNTRMADGAMQKTVDSGAGTTDISYVTSNGVTPLSDGFTLGTDTDLNVATEIVFWEAFE